MLRPRLASVRLYGHAAPASSVQSDLRALLRESAQPVAVATCLMADENRFHGATLSSFTSISMDPYPLIAFALRVPSRLATTLASLSSSSSPNSHLVVNLLSSRQSHTALHFSRADVHPEPFSENAYTLSRDGLPILNGSLGALSCRLVRPPLGLTLREGEKDETDALPSEGGVASELIIARVLRVEKFAALDDESHSLLPLVYHRQRYTTVLSTEDKKS